MERAAATAPVGCWPSLMGAVLYKHRGSKPPAPAPAATSVSGDRQPTPACKEGWQAGFVSCLSGLAGWVGLDWLGRLRRPMFEIVSFIFAPPCNPLACIFH
jgi:hypothetical protein